MSLVIMGMEIRQDLDGLYSLNDIHKASGKGGEKRPSIWLDNEQPNEVIGLLELEAGIPASRTIRGGRHQGTYVCKELVILYATWLDTRFCVEVMSAFNHLLQGDLQSAVDIALRNALRLGYPGLQATLKETRTEQGKETKTHHHTNEADLLNRVVLNMSSKKYKALHGLDEKADLRDHLNTAQKEQLAYLQQVDTALIAVGDTYEERKSKLTDLFKRKYG